MATQFTIIGSTPAACTSTDQTLELNSTDLNRNQDQIIVEQMNQVLEDSTLSIEELEKPENQQLATYLVEVLGYGSIRAFVVAHASRSSTQVENKYSQIPLTPENIDAIEQSITGSLNGNGLRVTADETGQLPTEVDETLSFVEFTLIDGQIITFDGPNAGQAANSFVIAYNNSETFATHIHFLASKQDDHYAFHLLPLKESNKGIVVGFNFAGNDSPLNQSGVFLQSEHPYNLLRTIIHEVGHDLHGENENDIHDTGNSHSREQSLFLSKIVNEIENQGINTGINVDADDYSVDTLVFNTNFKKNDNSTVRSSPRSDYTTYQTLFEQLNTAIDQGDFIKAFEIWSTLSDNPTIELSFRTPNGAGWTEPKTFSIQTLFLQDLMLSTDSGDRFNDNTNNIADKTNFGIFLNTIVMHNPELRHTVYAAAEEIGYELPEELPLYAFAPTGPNFNQIFDQT